MLVDKIKAISARYRDYFELLDDRYQLICKLGEGRYGKVYLALDLKDEILVAIKLLKELSSKAQLVSFLHEIKHLIYLLDCAKCDKNLRVTRILAFSFSGQINNSRPAVYYVMEFIELGEFYGAIDSGFEFSEKLACFFLKQLLNSLRKLHSFHFYHFDMKPENLLLDSRGRLFLCDFGCSLYAKRPKTVNWSKVKFRGSPEYAAPEVYELELAVQTCKNQKELYTRISEYNLEKLDTFSFGVLAFVTVIKSLPFTRATIGDPFYRKFVECREEFWQIFSKYKSCSKSFKELVNMLLEPSNTERADVVKTEEQHWFLNHDIDEAEIAEELNDFITLQKRIFLKHLEDKLEAKAVKRKTSFEQPFVYKGGVSVLTDYVTKHKKKLENLRMKLEKSYFGYQRNSPSELSSVSNNSSDIDS